MIVYVRVCDIIISGCHVIYVTSSIHVAKIEKMQPRLFQLLHTLRLLQFLA